MTGLLRSQPVGSMHLHADAQVHNEGGSKRVVVTKPLPGDRWLKILTAADCRVEVSQHEDTILSNKLVKDLIGKECDGVIGQLTEVRLSSTWAVVLIFCSKKHGACCRGRAESGSSCVLWIHRRSALPPQALAVGSMPASIKHRNGLLVTRRPARILSHATFTVPGPVRIAGHPPSTSSGVTLDCCAGLGR